METIIVTDSSSDLPLQYIQKNQVPVVELKFNFKGKEYKDDFGKSLSYKRFYEKVREGELPTTSQVNTYQYIEFFKKYVMEGKSIIYIGFSSELSGSLNNARIAKEEIKKKFKNADISIIDTKSASLGEGLLVYYAYEMLKKGYSKKEIVAWLQHYKFKVNHWFTVDSLKHLKRGGRISNVAATIGGILNIKPILNVNKKGNLVPISKVRGRKKSIKVLQEKLKQRIINPENQVIAISHGDCIEEAEQLKNLILKEYKVKNVIINNVGPVIGAHSGPGTLALFFIGKER